VNLGISENVNSGTLKFGTLILLKEQN